MDLDGKMIHKIQFKSIVVKFDSANTFLIQRLKLFSRYRRSLNDGSWLLGDDSTNDDGENTFEVRTLR